MSRAKELLLREYAGQGCDVKIVIRESGSAYVSFRALPGYGYPSLEKDKLEALLEQIEELEGE